MTAIPGPRHPATREELDDLQVLRAGLYGDAAAPRPLAVTADVARAARDSGRLVVVDPEGVPVAALDSAEVGDDGRVSGALRWLAEPSPRPFQDLQLRAVQPLLGRPVTIVRGASDLPADPRPGTYLLVLASTSVDGPTGGNDLVRAAVDALSGVPDGAVGVVPLPLQDPDRVAAFLATAGVAADGGLPRPSPPSTRGRQGVAILLTGLSGSGKSTIARALAMHLIERGETVTLLDGDRVRRALSAGLGFGHADRETNVRRVGWVAAEVAHHGGIAVCSLIAPSEAVRCEVAGHVADRGGRFVLVHVSTPLEVCERRDRKGLYAAARRGEIQEFTGISAPYEVPARPDLRLDTTTQGVEECADALVRIVARIRDDHA